MDYQLLEYYCETGDALLFDETPNTASPFIAVKGYDPKTDPATWDKDSEVRFCKAAEASMYADPDCISSSVVAWYLSDLEDAWCEALEESGVCEEDAKKTLSSDAYKEYQDYMVEQLSGDARDRSQDVTMASFINPTVEAAAEKYIQDNIESLDLNNDFDRWADKWSTGR